MCCFEACFGRGETYSDPETDAAARRAAAEAAERRAQTFAGSSAGRAAAKTQDQIARERRQVAHGEVRPSLPVTAQDWN